MSPGDRPDNGQAGGQRLVFAARVPGQDAAGLPELVVEGLAEDDARELLESVLTGLPDILHYDRTPARHLPQRPHPHRRRLQPALRLADQRQGPPSGLKPHDDLQAHCPYLGPPNPSRS